MKRLLFLAMLAAASLPFQAGAETMEPFGRGSYAALLAGRAGRPLLVHFWSVTCAPCLAEMPVLARLRHRHPELDLIMVNTDPAADGRRVASILARHGMAEARNMAFADGLADRLFFDVDHSWRGELPRSQLVAASGEVKAVTGPLDEARLQEWLRDQEADDGAGRNPAGRR